MNSYGLSTDDKSNFVVAQNASGTSKNDGYFLSYVNGLSTGATEQIASNVETVIDALGNVRARNMALRSDAPLAPEALLDAFEKLGLKYIIDESFDQGQGVTSIQNGTLTLKKNDETIYHELGHVLDFISGQISQTSAFKDIYNQEKNKLKTRYAAYGLTSAQEFFAECVREYILGNKNLKSQVPQTYQVIQDALNNINDEDLGKLAKNYRNVWKKMGVPGYAKGTTSAKKGLSEVFENGPEMIVTPKGTFVPFEGGEGVIPAKQTRILMGLADSIANGGLKLQMPDMNALKIPEFRGEFTSNATFTFNNLINIEGNADAKTVNDIKEIAQGLINNKQFQENMT